MSEMSYIGVIERYHQYHDGKLLGYVVLDIDLAGTIAYLGAKAEAVFNETNK